MTLGNSKKNNLYNCQTAFVYILSSKYQFLQKFQNQYIRRVRGYIYFRFFILRKIYPMLISIWILFHSFFNIISLVNLEKII